MTLEQYETRIGDVSKAALVAGGEELLKQVTTRLAVATRHLVRVRAGTLTLVPGVVGEIETSFAWADELLPATEPNETIALSTALEAVALRAAKEIQEFLSTHQAGNPSRLERVGIAVQVLGLMGPSAWQKRGDGGG
jgi:hypothetical protein